MAKQKKTLKNTLKAIFLVAVGALLLALFIIALEVVKKYLWWVLGLSISIIIILSFFKIGNFKFVKNRIKKRLL